MIEKREKKEKERSHLHVSVSIFINKSGTECGPLSLVSRVPSLPHTLAGWLARTRTNTGIIYWCRRPRWRAPYCSGISQRLTLWTIEPPVREELSSAERQAGQKSLMLLL